MLGNFIADNIPRKEEGQLPEDIVRGVHLHRRIDEFTDNHHSFKNAVAQLRPYHRKYAPVVLDILNDHLLAQNWNSIFEEDLEDFNRRVYDFFADHVDRLPPKASKHVHILLEYEYLQAYKSKEGLEGVLIRMDRRTKFPSDFKSAVGQLYNEYHFYNEEFLELYKDLREFIN